MALVENKEQQYALEEGYKLEKIIDGLTYPNNLEFADGKVYFTEAGFSYPYLFATPSVSRLTSDGKQEVLSKDFNKPLIGLKWYKDHFLITHRSVLSKLSTDGTREDLIDDLPGTGDHHTNHIVIKDDKVYFGQGAATNAGVVGPDNLEFGWLKDYRDFHDVPAKDIRLTGINFRSRNPFNPLETIETGAFLPYGASSSEGQVIKGQVKSTSVIYRCNPDGSDLEVYAWGIRNPHALALSPDGKVYTVSQGMDDRGVRPFHSPDSLYEIKQDAWYGFPDYYSGIPVTELAKQKEVDNQVGFIMAEHPELTEPLHRFPDHTAAVYLEFSSGTDFQFDDNEVYVAEFGAGAPLTTGGHKSGAGFKISRFNLNTKDANDFYINRNPGAGGKGIERPVAIRFSPDGKTMYVVDFGILMTPKTGAIWMITKE